MAANATTRQDAVSQTELSPLSVTLWKQKASAGDGVAVSAKDASARLAWKDLTVTVASRKGGEARRVLDGLTGYAEPGTLTALMGPSGSGKSTLLDALAGRLGPGALLSGSVLLNGRKDKLSYGAAAYVTQDDECLLGTLTVRETITYSAQLRLPDDMPWEDKQALAEDTIAEMGLRHCANTVVGNWYTRGISGGEKRRLSIALEILTRPRLLFLDEPTTGLDSASAFLVVKTLQELAEEGRTIVAVVHQPSSQVFELFDRLCLLSGGKTVYFGEVSAAHQFFGEAGFPCPPRRNPADHLLRCINTDFDKVKEYNLRSSARMRIDKAVDPLDRVTAREATETIMRFYGCSQYNYTARERVEEISNVKGAVLDPGISHAGFYMQTSTLLRRSFTNMSRDIGYYWLRFALYVVLTIGIGTVYFNVGTKYSAIRGRAAASSFLFLLVTFMSVGGFPSFVNDMKVFRKERLNGHYSVLAFVISNTLSGVPFLAMIALVSGTMCYFMVRLHSGFSHYMFFILITFASITAVEALMMVITTLVSNYLSGIFIGAGIQGGFLLVSGYLRLPDDMPKPFWRYPVSYLSFHFWAQQGQFKNDYIGLMFDNLTPDLPKIPGDYALKNVFQIDVNQSKWISVSVIFSMIIYYRILFFIAIKINEGIVPSVRRYIGRRMSPQHKRRS